MTILGDSIIRGRRILPSVREPLTTFGDTFSFAWHVEDSGPRNTLDFTNKQVVSTRKSGSIVEINPKDGSVLRTKVNSGSSTPPASCEDPSGNRYYIKTSYKANKWGPNNTNIITDKNVMNPSPETVKRSSNAMWCDGVWAASQSGLDSGAGVRVLDSDCNAIWGALRLGSSTMTGLSYHDGVLLTQQSNIVKAFDIDTGVLLWYYEPVTTKSSKESFAVSNGLFVGAYYSQYEASSLMLIAFDTAGNVVWEVPDIHTFSTSQYFNRGSYSGGLCTDRFGQIYVIDSDGQDLLKFSKNGEFITSAFADGIIPDDGELPSKPHNIVVDNAGGVYISHSTKYDIIKLDQS